MHQSMNVGALGRAPARRKRNRDNAGATNCGAPNEETGILIL